MAGYLPGVVRACLEPDLGYARQALYSAGFRPAEAKRIVAETYRPDAVDARIRQMSRHTLRLFRATGVLDVPGAGETFAAARLTTPHPLPVCSFPSATSSG